jgi:hypothetical protein
VLDEEWIGECSRLSPSAAVGVLKAARGHGNSLAVVVAKIYIKAMVEESVD